MYILLVCQLPLGKAKSLVCYKQGLKAKRGKVPAFPFETWSHGSHALTCDLLLGADDKIGLLVPLLFSFPHTACYDQAHAG